MNRMILPAQRTGLLQSLGHGLRMGAREWRAWLIGGLWLTLSAQAAATPWVATLQAQLGHSLLAAGTGFGDRVLTIVELARGLLERKQAYAPLLWAVGAGLFALALGKLWLLGGLASRVQSADPPSWRNFFHAANARFFPMLRLAACCTPIVMVCLLPAFGLMRWARSVDETAIAATQAALPHTLAQVALVAALAFLWVLGSLAVVHLSAGAQGRIRARRALADAWRVLRRRPFACAIACMLFVLLGMGLWALSAIPLWHATPAMLLPVGVVAGALSTGALTMRLAALSALSAPLNPPVAPDSPRVGQ